MGNLTKSIDLHPFDGLSILLFTDITDQEEYFKKEWTNFLEINNIKGSVKVIENGKNWNETLELAKIQALERWTLLAPINSDPTILSWITEHSKAISELDGVSFRRKGDQAPWILRCFSCIFYYPIRFLLELPIGNGDTWLGWRNWFWELQGDWLFGVRNHDPLNPIRLLRTEWFQRIPFQSLTNWGNLEMLAKAHFLGARLAEELCPSFTTVDNPSGSTWRDITHLIKKPRFTANQVSEKKLEILGQALSPGPTKRTE